MEFGWINVFGGVTVILLLIPNIVYAIRHTGERNLCTNRFMNGIEQIGRYACILLMWFPLLVWKFAFAGIPEMILYIGGNGLLLTAYWIGFAVYGKRKTPALALALAILPACVFLMSGLLLRHWLLAGFAVLFALGHIYVTRQNTGQSGESREKRDKNEPAGQ